ncbi:SAM-dependent methyltransferase [Rhizobium sp. SL86]|uniref:SAM-dependent methyltransferase n=1 Tax=Rhizobium sp. SL86 TaxID=2995148 RepID=UPI0022737606|nr:methyltransferase domain-containing protein [Rhizobium sp. SL86]MCY1669383.1 methyltransferase domain-containing protein [Rhizobium sp. SL86]
MSTNDKTTSDFHEITRLIATLTNDHSHPNLNAIARKLHNIDAMALNLKYFGYELAAALVKALPPIENAHVQIIGLRSKPATQADMESLWLRYWLSELKLPLVFHRKLWEYAFVLQALYESDLLQAGMHGLGFGCGREPLPSYLASRGIKVTVTDLAPEQSSELGWVNSNQHTETLDVAFHSHLVDRHVFEDHAVLRYVDMNDIPHDLSGFDFCWSICALEHLGSISCGLDFIENSLRALRPGGVAIHTTEFNFMNDTETIDNWQTVLFQRRHFLEIAERLRAAGHHVAELDFSVGDKPLDKFIDIPPWVHDMKPDMAANWEPNVAHLKLNIDGFASTCFGLVIRKNG